MPTHVYANNNEIASKAADGKSIAAFPDVCFSPPAPPVGPLPLPYPNTGEVKNTDKGTAKVFVKDKMVGMEDSSYMTKSMGDEPATPSQGKGIITGALQGKCYFGLWSMDVQMEGKGVPRHMDLVTHNHASKPGQSVGADTDQTSGKTPPNEIKYVDLRGYCYELNFLDMYGNEISDELFKCKNNNLKSKAKLKFSNTVKDESKHFEQKISIHDGSNYITITVDDTAKDISNSSEDAFPFKEMFYNMLNFDYVKSNSTTNHTYESSLHYDDLVTLHNKKIKKCKQGDGYISTIDIPFIPTPHFPSLISGAWDQATAYNLALMSYISYDEFDKNDDGKFYGSLKDIARELCVSPNACIKDGKCFICKKTNLDGNYIFCHQIKKDSANCSILADKNDIIISFRGSKSKSDFITDAKIFMDEYDSGATIHRGFAQYYLDLRNDLITELNKIYSNQNIFITGHSLGGALGLICACEIKNYFSNSNISLYTYGMPRVFNNIAISKLPYFHHYRHVFESDPVPRLVLENLLPDNKEQLKTLLTDLPDYVIAKCYTNDLRQHHGELYYIERNRTIAGTWIREYYSPKVVVTSSAKAKADKLSLNDSYSLYIFKGNNRNFANSSIGNALQSLKTFPLIAGITILVEFFTVHTLDNYIKSLHKNLKKSILIGTPDIYQQKQ